VVTHPQPASTPADWPALPLADWADSCATLQLLTQVVGKIRLAHAPMQNHWWQVVLYVTSRGLTTSPMPAGGMSFEITFDFIDHVLRVQTSRGGSGSVPLGPRPVADFYTDLMGRLRALGIETRVWTMPSEIEDAIPFDQDRVHAAYDAAAVTRFWQALVQAERVMQRFRAAFLGKVSPVHFFWGSFDLAVTRFSGRTAPRLESGAPHVAPWVMQEAYSHEVSSAGFWPGNGGFGQAAFYSYAYPEPAGFAAAPTVPGAYYDQGLGQHILPYAAVRAAASPDALLLQFLRSSYAAAATLGGWDRTALERAAAEPAIT
jgi:hypothetical protein